MPVSRLIVLLRHPVFIVTCIALLLAPYFANQFLQQKLIAEPHDKALLAAAQIIPANLSPALTNELNERRQTLRDAATTALLENAQLDTASAHKQVAALLPDVSHVRFVQKPAGLVDQSDFVAKTLIDAALNGAHPPITTVKRAEWQVLMAEPVFGSDINDDTSSSTGSNTIGAILIEIPVAMLTAPLSTSDPALGRLELIQRIPGLGQQTLVSTGSTGVGNANDTPVTAVPGWLLRFTPAQKMIDQYHPDTTMFQALRAGLWILALLAIALVGKRLSRRLDKEDNVSDTSAPSTKAGTASTNKAQPKSQYLHKGEADTLSHSDDDVFDLDETQHDQPAESLSTEFQTTSKPDWPAHVFRDYDIRGLAETEIDEGFANALGQTLGTHTLDKEEHTVIVGRDGRLSSPALSEALIGGLLMSGCNVVDLGQAPTPAVNFASQTSTQANTAVIVTASHNPGTYNGFKIVSSGATLHGTAIQTFRDDMLAQRWSSGEGSRTSETIGDAYLDAICQDIETLTPLSVVVDCGNGVAGTLAPQLMEKLGCECIPLYCDVNGAFPNHPPDPTQPANLQDLIQVVEQAKADIGLAFDGDGDRLVAITASGRIVWPDELLMIFARDIVTRHPGSDIVFDVKSTRRLSTLISDYGGRPVMWKTGHAHIREKIAELQAPLGGEFSGHLFFNDRWHGFDDGLYAAARLLEILSLREQSLDALLSTFEPTVATAEIRLAVEEADKFSLMEKIVAAASFEDANIHTLDGLRVDFENSWGLVRASNTEAALTLRFEADDTTQLSTVQHQFKALLASVAPELELKLEQALSSESA